MIIDSRSLPFYHSPSLLSTPPALSIFSTSKPINFSSVDIPLSIGRQTRIFAEFEKLGLQNNYLSNKKTKLGERFRVLRFDLEKRERRRRKERVICSANEENAGEREGEGARQSNLGMAIRRKQATIQARLKALGDVDVESLLADTPAVANPQPLMDLLADRVVQGRTAVIAEVARISPAEEPDMMVERCQEYVEWGADAIFLCCDEEQTPDGASDLYILSQGLNVPVLRKDWILHPLQISDTASLGGAGINLIPAVLGRGTVPLLQYALSLGLDAIVEVVNYKEVEEMAQFAVSLYGVNISIGLSIAIPGARQSVASSIIENLPFGAASIVGITSVEEGRKARESGSTGIVVRREALQGFTEKEFKKINAKKFLQDLSYAMTGDS